MKILKINQIKNLNLKYTKPKHILTKQNLVPKIDMFYKTDEVLNILDKNFSILREDFSAKLYKNALKMGDADWNFFTNSNDQNLKMVNEVYDEYSNIYKDKIFYDKFKQIDKKKLNKHELKHLEEILKNFKNNFELSKELEVLRQTENNIAQKFNSYIPNIDNKEVSKTEISRILENESSIDIRKKAYDAKIKGGDLITEDLKNLVKIRNDFARKRGFSNYYEYSLKEVFEVDLNDLTNLLDETFNKYKKDLENIFNKKQKELREIFDTEKLEQYHYGYLSENNPDKRVNEFFKTKEQILEISKKAYNSMGFDVDKLIAEGKLTLDLYPRKGKNTHGFCFDIDAGRDARILANLSNNSVSLDTLNHEMGHCVYTLGISRDLTYMDRDCYPAMTEAVAMMMGDLHKRENLLIDIVPQDLLEKFKSGFVEDELLSLSKRLVIINFEKEMYKNPDQDLKKLWHEMRVKYSFADKNEELNNEWATIPHYLSHPAYYQNYFRANIYKNKIYDYLVLKLGNLTENYKTAEFLGDKLFKYGKSLEEKDLMKNFE